LVVTTYQVELEGSLVVSFVSGTVRELDDDSSVVGFVDCLDRFDSVNRSNFICVSDWVAVAISQLCNYLVCAWV
jgi:hypothetical protein